MATLAEIRQQYPQYEDMSDRQLADALYSKHYSDMPRADFDQKVGLAPAQTPNAIQSAQSGLMQGMTFGWGDEILGTMMAPIEMGIDAVQGKPFDPGRSWNQAVERNRQGFAEAEAANPTAFTVGNVAGSVGSGIGAARGGLTLLNGAKPTALSMGGRGLAEGAAYGALAGAGEGETAQERMNLALQGGAIGGAFGGALGAGAGALANRAAQNAIPSVEALKDSASTLYETARKSGATLAQPASAQMAQNMRAIAAAEGIITPTGRINNSYQKVSELIRSFDDYAQGNLSVDQMQSVRRLIQNALKSPDGDERRIAMAMMDEFHRFLDPIAPEIAQANQIYSRAMKGDMIETAIELAGARAGQFSGSGFENALRTEFRALDRAIVKGQLKGLSGQEILAIQSVARGGKIENVARYLGKLAPTGIVSMGGSFGIPFAVGNAIGGPGLGAALGAGTMGVGMAGRSAATAMTLNNARLAAAMARSGGQMPQVVSGAAPAVTQALTAGAGAQAPQLPLPQLPLPRLTALN
jgi:hypothetical protein